MDDALNQVVESWWRDKANDFGGIIPPESVQEIATQSKLFGLQTEEFLQVAQSAGLLSSQATIRKQQEPVEEVSTEPPTGENTMPRHPDAEMGTKDFVRKYAVECGGGSPTLLFAKAQEIGLECTLSSINSAKYELKKKEGWTPDGGGPETHKEVSIPQKRGRKPKPVDDPFEERIAQLEKLSEKKQQAVFAAQAELNNVLADIAALKRAKEILAS